MLLILMEKFLQPTREGEAKKAGGDPEEETTKLHL